MVKRSAKTRLLVFEQLGIAGVLWLAEVGPFLVKKDFLAQTHSVLHDFVDRHDPEQLRLGLVAHSFVEQGSNLCKICLLIVEHIANVGICKQATGVAENLREKYVDLD